CSKFPLRLPSDPTVTGDALAYGLSSRWSGDRVSFNPSARQTCRANKTAAPLTGPLFFFYLKLNFEFGYGLG
ncbi:MAG TPA: hypothetical protein VJ036_07225, partial [bacterium]|nr:hypothetical protein [bacterium]